MSSIKCPNCGLTNFASDSECKRCHKELPDSDSPGRAACKQPEPKRLKVQSVTTDLAEDIGLEDYDGRHPIGNILFAIYVGLTAVSALALLLLLNFTTTPEIWRMINDPVNKHYLPTMEPFFYFMWLAGAGFLFAGVILLMKLYRKSSAFLSLVPFYLMAQFCYFVVEGLMTYKLGGELRARNLSGLESVTDLVAWFPILSLIGVVITFIWLRYFATSQRARLLFQ